MILVPTDFTKVADCALNHALTLSGKLKTDISLLHVIDKEKERDEAQAKLNKIIAESAKNSTVKITPVIKVGNIFDDIGGVAKEQKAQFIIMGTHGVTGLQHITGSHALKVMTNSAIPFIVVQEREIKDGYFNIVCPMDLSKDTKQKMELTVQVAKYFGSKIYFCSPHATDEFFMNTIKRNIAFAENECKKNGVKCESTVFEKSGNFVKQTLKLAASVNADLITIINGQEAGVHEYIVGTEERQIITNEAQIPVMCINPTSVGIAGSILFS